MAPSSRAFLFLSAGLVVSVASCSRGGFDDPSTSSATPSDLGLTGDSQVSGDAAGKDDSEMTGDNFRGDDNPTIDPFSALNDDFNAATLSSQWTVHLESDAAISLSGGSLTMTPTASGLWVDDEEVRLNHQPTSGNFAVTMALSTENALGTGPPQPSWRFAGLMIRKPSSAVGGNQNYVLAAMGAGGSSQVAEAKTTVNSASTYNSIAWPQAYGQLRLCRFGDEISVWVRLLEGDTWQNINTYTRSDIPNSVDAGFFVEARQSPPDIVAIVDFIRFHTVTVGADCELL